MSLSIALPGYAEPTQTGLTLHIPCLGIKTEVESFDNIDKSTAQAITNATGIKVKTVNMVPVEHVHYEKRVDGRTYYEIQAKEWDRLLDTCLDREPLVDMADRAKRLKENTHLQDVSAEDIVNYGYPAPWDTEE